MKCYHPEYTGGNEKPHVNDIIKLMMSEIKLSGILSPGVVKIFNRSVLVTANKRMDVCGVFETIFMWIKSVAMKEVKLKIQQLSDAITIKFPSGNIYDLPTIIKNVKYANKKSPFLLIMLR
ncbi:hypothetical protein [Sodalis glossinidius]|uniref:hypothetical protein n=1 Tax=Sodalis glossinidius TaxID=63612 RepID=UPI0005A487DA|nr:hypothetical protein [Sodalis glossinidius]